MRLIAVAVLSIVVAPRVAEASNDAVDFPTLISAHIKANLGASRIPVVSRGVRASGTSVYLTVTRNRILLYGTRLIELDKGQVPAKLISRCGSGAPCIPSLRDRIKVARAQLGVALETTPAILVFIDREARYQPLILALRSAAEAGAHLSIRLAVADRRGKRLELPVLIAPGRTRTIRSAAPSVAISVALNQTRAVITAHRSYLERPTGATGVDDILSVIGRLQLRSGRRAYFLSATPHTAVGHVTTLISESRNTFAHVVLHGWGERPVVSR